VFKAAEADKCGLFMLKLWVKTLAFDMIINIWIRF
jgi:hypothetical protein